MIDFYRVTKLVESCAQSNFKLLWNLTLTSSTHKETTKLLLKLQVFELFSDWYYLEILLSCKKKKKIKASPILREKCHGNIIVTS